MTLCIFTTTLSHDASNGYFTRLHGFTTAIPYHLANTSNLLISMAQSPRKGGLGNSKYASAPSPTTSLPFTSTQPQQQPQHGEDLQPTREEALQAELAGLQRINEVIEGVLSSLDRARESMSVSIYRSSASCVCPAQTAH